MSLRWSIAILVVVGLVVVCVPRARPEPVKTPIAEKLLKARLEAARRTYETVWQNNREALVPFVEVGYRWSRRWLEAELDLSEKREDRAAALRGHVERMQRLARITNDRFRNRANTIEEVSAAEFYLAEATIWQEQGRLGSVTPES